MWGLIEWFVITICLSYLYLMFRVMCYKGGFVDRFWEILLWPVYAQKMREKKEIKRNSLKPKNPNTKFTYIGGNTIQIISHTPDKWIVIKLKDGELFVWYSDKVITLEEKNLNIYPMKIGD